MKAFIGSDRATLLRAILLPTIAALLVATAVGGFVWQRIDDAQHLSRESAFNLATNETTLKIEERFKAYRQVLRGARALFAASQEVTRSEWRDYVTGLRLHEDYAGIQGVGYAIPVPAAELAAHERRIRAEGFPSYQVSPAGKRPLYTTIVYLEPFDWRNQRAFGYDMYAEPVRHEAMERARTLGVPVLSGKVRLVQETSTDTQAGVLLYLPVFRNGASFETTSRRDQAFMGWVYSPFRLGDLITGTLGESNIHIRIYDGDTDAATALLYDSDPERSASRHQLVRRSLLELDHRVWTLIFEEAPPTDDEVVLAEKTAVVLASGLFVLLAASFSAARQRAIALDRLSASLLASEARYSTLVNLSQDGIAALDHNLRFTFVNPRLVTLLGYSVEQLLERRLDSLWPSANPRGAQAMVKRLQSGQAAHYEQQLRRADGTLITTIVTDAPQLDGGGQLQGAIITFTDISERKASEERIHYLATHDALTGLANRAQFLDRMNNSLLLAIRHSTRLALLFLDLDRFKQINDTLGHAAGDALLVEAAKRMQMTLRASDLLARQGGDEFMILLHDIKGVNEANGVAAKIRQAIDRPFILEGSAQHISVSIGVALFPDDGLDMESLTRYADAAMYRAKLAGRAPPPTPPKSD